jgi:hypothetical protein
MWNVIKDKTSILFKSFMDVLIYQNQRLIVLSEIYYFLELCLSVIEAIFVLIKLKLLICAVLKWDFICFMLYILLLFKLFDFQHVLRSFLILKFCRLFIFTLVCVFRICFLLPKEWNAWLFHKVQFGLKSENYNGHILGDFVYLVYLINRFALFNKQQSLNSYEMCKIILEHFPMSLYILSEIITLHLCPAYLIDTFFFSYSV